MIEKCTKICRLKFPLKMAAKIDVDIGPTLSRSALVATLEEYGLVASLTAVG